MAITTQHKGKRGELLVFAELLRRGAEVYTPLVDVGVDAVARGEGGRLIELQVKATEAENQDRYFNFYWEPKVDRYYICVSLKDDPPSVWILPCGVFNKYATKSGGYWRLALPEKRRGDQKSREVMLEQYCATKNENAWLPLLPP